MLIYRTQRNIRKQKLKLIHASLMLLTIALVVISLVAVFDSHNLNVKPIPNMYSLHSWIGLTSIILFCCQVFLIIFLYLSYKFLLHHARNDSNWLFLYKNADLSISYL